MSIWKWLVAAGAVVAMVIGGAVAREGARAAAVEAQARADVRALMDEMEVRPRQVMLLGTFHFKDAGLDGYKPQHQFDALSEQRQKEIEEIARELAEFNPTRICVEYPFTGQDKLDAGYQAYLRGERENRPNELYQLGMRLAKKLGHKTVYAVDAQGRWYEPRVDVMAYAQEHGQEELMALLRRPELLEFLHERDREIDTSSLRETLLYMNSEPMIAASHGIYLMGGFGIGEGAEYPGVDGFVSSWYNRNLKIFQNLRRVSEPGERVLLIIGAGHLPIIRHAAQCSHEFEVVEVAEYLRGGER